MRTTRSKSTVAKVALAVLGAMIAFGLALPASPAQAANGDSKIRSLTKAQKKAKAKAIKKCKKIKAKSKRKACVKKVNKRFAPKKKSPRVGKIWKVDVWDNYYAPGTLNVKVYDAIEWVWKETSREGHNVSMFRGPRGVSPYDFESRILYNEGEKFRRQIKVAGAYSFYCTLHAGMDMQVNARK
jgi:plastocyanin